MLLNVIKIGGNVIDNAEALTAFVQNFAKLKHLNILIHGGGKIATRMAEKLGINTEMVDGRRVTSAAMRDVATMVYGGLVNKDIVAQMQCAAIQAIGLTGADAGVIRAHKRPVKTIDYGYVGDVDHVNAEMLKNIIELGLVPVLAPLTHSTDDGLLNTNADTIAAEVAVAMAKHYEVNLVYCFEKKGVLLDITDDNSVIPLLGPIKYASLKASGCIFEGMIPKLDNAFGAIAKGVKQVTICQAEDIVMALNDGESGTKIVDADD